MKEEQKWVKQSKPHTYGRGRAKSDNTEGEKAGTSTPLSTAMLPE